MTEQLHVCCIQKHCFLGRRQTIKEGFFSVEGNLEKAGAALGTFYQAALGQGLRVEAPEEKEASGKARWLQKNRHSRACGRRNEEDKRM